VGGGAVEEHQHNRRRLLRIGRTEMRRVIYTPDAIDALNRQLQKAPKTKGHFPTEDAAKAAN
jgi:transposase-like protein